MTERERAEVATRAQARAAARVRAKRWARTMLAGPRLGPLVGASVGRLGAATSQAAPRLTSLYRKLPSAQGLPFGTSTELQRAYLLDYYARLDAQVAQQPHLPLISIVVPTYRPDPAFLREMLASVALQTYERWQLCIVDDASEDPPTTAIIEEFVSAHPGQVEFRQRTSNGHIVAASNDGLALATGEYVALLDHDDRLYPHALAEVVLEVNAQTALVGQRPWVLYTDERMIDDAGRPLGEAWFKPDWMPLLHLTSNYTNHLTVYDRDLLVRLGGFRTGFDGSQDHDLMLRATQAAAAAGRPVAHVPTIAYQWRSHPGSVAMNPEVKSYSIEPAMRAVAEACARRGTPARVWREPGIVANRIDFDLPEPPPSVAVVVWPDGGDPVRCRTAVEVGTDYPNLQLTAHLDGHQWTIHDLAALLVSTDAEYVMCLSDRLAPTRRDWVTAMVGVAQLPEVGVVGGLVLDLAGRVESAGAVGIGAGGAAPAMRGMPPTEDVYLAWPASIHEVLVTPGTAMLLDVAAVRVAGGIDTAAFAAAFWDTDLCLRMREHGYGTVFTPYAVFTAHAPQPADGIVEREHRQLLERWGGQLCADPYLNPGLARDPAFRVDPDLVSPEIPPELFAHWLQSGRCD